MSIEHTIQQNTAAVDRLSAHISDLIVAISRLPAGTNVMPAAERPAAATATVDDGSELTVTPAPKRARKKSEAPAVEPTDAGEPAEPTEAITADALNLLMVTAIHKAGAAPVKALLASHGAERLSLLDPKRYLGFKTALDSIIAADDNK